MRPDAASFAEAVGLDSALVATHLPEDCRQADARAGRGLPHRFRGWLRQPPRRRGRPLRASAAGETAARRCLATAAGRHRHPHQAAQRRAESAQPAHPRSVRQHRCSNTPAGTLPAGLRRHAAEDHRARAGRRAGLGLRRARARSSAGRGFVEDRADGRDHPVDLRRRWHHRAAAPGRRRRRTHRRRPLRHLRLHGGGGDYRRASAHDASGLRLREERDAGRARRTAEFTSPTARPT